MNCNLLTTGCIALLATSLPLSADPLAECRDDRLRSMTASALRDALTAAGGRDCAVREANWGESVACQGTVPGTRAFGLPVRELSAEVQDRTGQRTLAIVTDGSGGKIQRQRNPQAAADGLKLTLEQDATGVTVISCVARGPTLDAGPEASDEQLATTLEAGFEERP